MAHKKGVGSTDNGRDSKSKRLGVKLFGGQAAKAGNIIVRQRGTKWHSGNNTYLGKDFTIHAKVDGKVQFTRRKNNKVFVNIVPFEIVEEKLDTKKDVVATREVPSIVETATMVEEAPKESMPSDVPVETQKSSSEVLTTEEQVVEEIETTAKEVVEENIVSDDVVIAQETPPTIETTSTTEENATKNEEKLGASQKIALPSGEEVQLNDLTVIEGIGPKIAELLRENEITTWESLATISVERLNEILTKKGAGYANQNPSTWPEQAQLAVDRKWEELQKLQDYLLGGVDPNA